MKAHLKNSPIKSSRPLPGEKSGGVSVILTSAAAEDQVDDFLGIGDQGIRIRLGDLVSRLRRHMVDECVEGIHRRHVVIEIGIGKRLPGGVQLGIERVGDALLLP